MSRKMLWSVAAVFVFTGVIVMVRAQDTTNEFTPNSSTPKRTSLAERLKAIRQGISSDSRTDEKPSVTSSTPANSQNSILRRKITDQNSEPTKPSSTPPVTTITPRPATQSFDSTPNSTSQFRPRRPTNVTNDQNLAPIVTKTPITPTTGPDENRQAQLPSRPVEINAEPTKTGSPSARRAERVPSVARSIISEPTQSSPISQEPARTFSSVPANSGTNSRIANRSFPTTTNSNNAVGQVEIKSLGPVLKIFASGPKAITIGKPATFVVQAANMSNEAAESVVVSIQLPEWVEVRGNRPSVGTVRQQADAQDAGRLIWTIERLAGRGESQLNMTLVAKESRPVDLGIDWAFRPESASARIQVQEPRLQLAVSGPVDVLYGDKTTYTISISNPGTGDAENVAINLPAEFGGGQKDLGTIAAGARQQFEVPLVSRQSGEVAVRVQAVADGGLRNESTHRVLIRRAELAIEVGGPSFKYAGSVVKYQVKVTNVGDAIAKDVLAAAALPTGAKYVGGLQGAEQVDGGLRWSIGQLNPGADRFYEVSCELLQAGQNEFQAGARTNGDVSAADAVTTTVEALADLKLSVNDPSGPKPVGQTVTYELKIINRGTKAAKDVKIVLQFSDGVEPVEVEGARAELVPGQVLFENISQIPAGTEVSLVVRARADKAGNHVYRTVLSCPDPETRRVSEGTTRFFSDDNPTTANTEFAPANR